MVVGNAPVIPESIASPISTLTSQIALDMGYSSGLHRAALFGMGVVLFIISAGLVGAVRIISRPKKEKVDTQALKQARLASEEAAAAEKNREAAGVSTATAAATAAVDTELVSAVEVPEGDLTAAATAQREDLLVGEVTTPYEMATLEDDLTVSELAHARSVQETSRERIKRLLANGQKARVNKRTTNNLMLGVFRAAGLVATLVLVLIILFVAINGFPAMSLEFIFGWPRGVNAEGGIFPTIVSSLYVTALAMVICTPIAVLAAVYLAEYAKQGRLVNFIRYATDTLSSVPSIVMGLFGYAMFVEAMGFGLSMLSAALALALMMLPIVMRTTEEAIRAVPRYVRWGAYGLGATKWQVVSRVVLPSAFPRIATGIVLAIGRAVGETAVVLYTMGQAINLPITPLDSGRPMTIHLYLLANDGINMQAAYGTALLLMLMILAFNLFARYLSNKSANKAQGK
jgi:phosphate transport system permease protein